MALIKCPNCKHEVSSSAKTCPHCGETLEKKEKNICHECGEKISVDETTCPKCGFPLPKTKNAKKIIYDGLNKITGANEKGDVTFKDIFSGSFSKHTDEEKDELFTCGSSKTTPKLKYLDSKNVKPWIYIKVLILFVLAFVIMYIGYMNYNNMNFLPGMILLGTFAIPVTVLIFFFEINIFKNIPLYKVLRMFILGGCASLILAILYFSLYTFSSSSIGYVDAIVVGIIEEVAKAVLVVYFIYKCKNANYILNGLLIGAAVGAGFAAFETAGYILNYGLSGGKKLMIEVLELRALLAPGGHVAWAAIEGAGLMYIKGLDVLNKKHFNDPKFLGIVAIPVVLHAIWDMPFVGTIPMNIGYFILIILAWIVLIYFINLGLKQIDDVKKIDKNQ